MNYKLEFHGKNKMIKFECNTNKSSRYLDKKKLTKRFYIALKIMHFVYKIRHYSYLDNTDFIIHCMRTIIHVMILLTKFFFHLYFTSSNS
jgi:hypothetical protein